MLRSGLENMIKAIEAYANGTLKELEPMQPKPELQVDEELENEEEDEAAAVYF